MSDQGLYTVRMLACALVAAHSHLRDAVVSYPDARYEPHPTTALTETSGAFRRENPR
ncbi:hypothetical protein OH76DRAFT_1407798 [Lentinus brumalis]|uniref:Uncharacterized protein n=1 Tax=Lentinus brumalis TaxID=2498619 RepID=A0A371CZC9_9APHY|nr:hypothetical protein OH76DRAFT_1407798 [Polyporus brumalis]